MSENTDGEEPPPKPRREARKQVLLRLDPKVYDALARWASDELRSANAQIEFLLRKSLTDAGRLPKHTGPIPRRGRPPKAPDQAQEQEQGQGQGQAQAQGQGQAQAQEQAPDQAPDPQENEN